VKSDTKEGALPDHSADAFLGGRVMLLQPLKGHRAGLDAALLQALVPADASGRAVDLGTGAGTVAFCMAARAPNLTVIGIERDADLAACAQAALERPENVGFAGRVRIVKGDVTVRGTLRAAGLGEHSAEWVLLNPPYDKPGRARASPDAARRAAHVAAEGALAAWCLAAAELLAPGGRLGLIHRAEALAEILNALAGRFGDIRILPVHPSESLGASRVLVRARRGSGAPLRLGPPLFLHGDGSTWTEAADAILRGRADLAN
jgi:tRNA1(Val) A37 N6-methylase TrmN6